MKNGNKRSTIPMLKMVLISMSVLFIVSCSNDNKKPADSTQKNATAAGEQAELSDSLKQEMSDAANEVCDCISDLENSLSSSAKDMIIKAGKSENPRKTLEDEIQNISDSVEQQKIVKEFEDVEKSNVVGCVESIRKKHPVLKNTSLPGRKRLLTMVEENCSEFAAAMIRLGQ